MPVMQTDVEREARRIIAAHYSGLAVENDAVEWAVLALTAGLDEPNVRMLAASERPANWFEVEPYFRAALDEVGVPWPDRDEALRAAARDTAAAILSGEADPKRGTIQIARIAIALDYPDELMDFYMLEDELDIQYGPNRVRPAIWEASARRAAERLVSFSRGTGT